MVIHREFYLQILKREIQFLKFLRKHVIFMQIAVTALRPLT